MGISQCQERVERTVQAFLLILSDQGEFVDENSRPCQSSSYGYLESERV